MVLGILRFLLLSAMPLMSYAAQKQHYPKPIHQFLAKHCYACHGNKKHKGDINFEATKNREEIIKHYRLWESAKEQVLFSEMPPKKKKQPSEKEKKIFSEWISGVLKEAADKNKNDPGHVVIRRLNQNELENTIFDLTGLKYELGDRLPADGGGGEGFTNMGSALYTSPNHLEAYLKLFEEISQKAAILPVTGLQFQETEIGSRGQDAIQLEIIKKIRQKYNRTVSPLMPGARKDLHHKEYLLAAWAYKNNKVFKFKNLSECAKKFNVNPIFLENWIKYLDSTKPKSRFLDSERIPFRSLPKATSADIKQIPKEVHQKLNEIVSDRMEWYKMQRPQQDSNAYNPYYKRLNFNQKMKYFTIMVTDNGDGTKGDVVIWKNMKMHVKTKGRVRTIQLKKYMEEHLKKLQTKKQTPESKKMINHLKIQIARFGKSLPGMKLDPNHLVIKGKQKMIIPLDNDHGFFEARSVMWTKGPNLNIASAQQVVIAGAHWGTVPDLVPGFVVVYDDTGDVRHRIFAEIHPMREIFGFEKFYRMLKIEENYLGNKKLPIVYYMSKEQVMSLLSDSEQKHFQAMHEDYSYYYRVSKNHIYWRIKQAPRHKDGTANFAAYTKEQRKKYDGAIKWVADGQKILNEKVFNVLLEFAEKAWRRPLESHEKNRLNRIYHKNIDKGLLSEDAGRVVMQRIFLSPHFLFRIEKAKAKKEHRLSQIELANRLSYSLWASQPDERLMTLAKQGKLYKKKIFDNEIKRMLKDERASRLSKQFMGEWLEFKGFNRFDGLDKKSFPMLTSKIKKLMEQESEMFFKELIRNDRSVMDIYNANYTYLNQELAKYYHIPNITGPHFRKVNVKKYQRGGLFGMGAMLVKTSYPQRTSPVLRGVYVLENILGHHLPAPPDDVPQLEEVSKKTNKAMSVRQLLEIHRKNESCASCHDKIDPLGFALEGFGPDALVRHKDKGVKVDTKVFMKGVKPFTGSTGLKAYLLQEEDKLLMQLCRKFLGYSLGREVGIGDRDVLNKMMKSLKGNQYRFSAMVRSLYHSNVFQYRRGLEGKN